MLNHMRNEFIRQFEQGHEDHTGKSLEILKLLDGKIRDDS